MKRRKRRLKWTKWTRDYSRSRGRIEQVEQVETHEVDKMEGGGVKDVEERERHTEHPCDRLKSSVDAMVADVMELEAERYAYRSCYEELLLEVDRLKGVVRGIRDGQQAERGTRDKHGNKGEDGCLTAEELDGMPERAHQRLSDIRRKMHNLMSYVNAHEGATITDWERWHRERERGGRR
ncbi:hypothetical protein CI109_105414 [Kwoniella shandongensis]|uniref:Uncharacterized protein n=1 Tax=Kwoniella shandongensis TaxID=1734106 RepID=A0AAJ8MZM4_9TREE